MTKNDFFFCYNKKLFSYLRDVKDINYITVAQSPASGQTFAMFYKSSTLQQALDEYKNTKV